MWVVAATVARAATGVAAQAVAALGVEEWEEWEVEAVVRVAGAVVRGRAC